MDQNRFKTIVNVRFRDIDCLNHVNNAVVVTYIEQARTEFMFEMLDKTSLDQINFIMARLECDYRMPIEYGDTVEIGTGVKRIGTKSITLDYALESGNSNSSVAEAETVVVFYDYERSESIPVPEEFTSAVEAYRLQK